MKTKIKSKVKKYEVELSSTINPDDYQREYVRPEIKTERVSISSFAEAVEVVGKFINKYGLGGGNWSGGKIYKKGSHIAIAHISYNGRVWEGGDYVKNAKEIKI